MTQSSPQAQAKELTITPGQAHLRSFAYFLPAAILFVFLFYMLWPERLSLSNYKSSFPGIGVVVSIMVTGIVVHELIHGLTWAIFAPSGFRSIRFGILWKSMTPYCHCREPLPVRPYCIGAAMPGIILGILPMVVSLASGSIALLAFGLFFTLAAGGDIMIIRMLIGTDRNHLVQDHPSKIGCLIYKKSD